MASYLERYRLWTDHPYFDAVTQAELRDLQGRPAEIEDRFYRELEFGTGGLRGIIGAGTNRMNRYVVRQVTRGLAEYIAGFGPAACRGGVVIAHDSRRFSPEFAREAALVLAAAGIRAYLWESLRPTPMLSFAVRELGATAGIVVTASHNPPEYNGYKVYWSDGGQVPPERAQAIAARIAATDLTTVHPLPAAEARAAGLLESVPEHVDRAYLDRLLGLVGEDRAARAQCRILYTPLHGSGGLPVGQVLREAGFQVRLVREQAVPDPDFTTVRTPNPEEPSVFRLALAQAAADMPDVILATDPDADRLGVMTLDEQGSYRLLTGNQIGALLVEFLLEQARAAGRLPANGAVLKSIATSNQTAAICQAYGVRLVETHTGFKFIGEQIQAYEQGGSHTFLFGYEESYGYLAGTFVRDKDAVMAALLMAETAAWHRQRGRTLYGALEALWQRYGCFRETLHSLTLPGRDGVARMAALMAGLRSDPPQAFGPMAVDWVDDYRTGLGCESGTGRNVPLGLSRADVLHYRTTAGEFVMVRPSGTEPKLKVYVSVCAGAPAEAEERLQAVSAAVLEHMGLNASAP